MAEGVFKGSFRLDAVVSVSAVGLHQRSDGTFYISAES